MVDYDANMIKLISWRESVRTRPGMYIGGTGDYGKFHLALEILGNSVDLFLRGAAKKISVHVHSDRSLEVIDDGPGFDVRQPEVRSWFEELSSRPTADGHSPHIHLGRWGVGLSVANFLSEMLRIETTFGSERLSVEWSDAGQVCSEVAVEPATGIGTSVRLWFDAGIFDSDTFPVGLLRDRMIELAGLLPGLELHLDGESWLFDDWEAGLTHVAGAEVASATAESAQRVDDVEIQIRMILEASGSTAEAHPVVFANYLRMDERGAFVERLEEELELLSTGSATSPRAFVSLTMAGPQISGPTRSRLDDRRTVAALNAMLAEHRDRLRNELRLAKRT